MEIKHPNPSPPISQDAPSASPPPALWTNFPHPHKLLPKGSSTGTKSTSPSCPWGRKGCNCPVPRGVQSMQTNSIYLLFSIRGREQAQVCFPGLPQTGIKQVTVRCWTSLHSEVKGGLWPPSPRATGRSRQSEWVEAQVVTQGHHWDWLQIQTKKVLKVKYVRGRDTNIVLGAMRTVIPYGKKVAKILEKNHAIILCSTMHCMFRPSTV